jgi:choline kinase
LRAIILAAGRGLRLHQPANQEFPKCLLRFAGTTLLERHLRLLHRFGVHEIVVAVGFRYRMVLDELEPLGMRPEIVLNPDFDLGSVLTVHVAAEALTRGGDVLLMDADVLYHERILALLIQGSQPVNRLLMDRNLEPGDEPVKVCLKDGVPIELRKQLIPGLVHDTVGESIGFFRFDESAAKRLAALAAGYVANGRSDLPHEEAVRDLLQERQHVFDVADVTGLPWVEVDFAEDVQRAEREILPRIDLPWKQAVLEE